MKESKVETVQEGRRTLCLLDFFYCLVSISIYSEDVSFLIEASQWTVSLHMFWRTSGCCHIYAKQRSVFCGPIFHFTIFFSQFVFRDGSDGSECESVLAQDETHKENTKPLLLLTLRSPVSGTLSPSLYFSLLFLQPHLFLTGQRGVLHHLQWPLSFFTCPASLPSILTLKRTQKELRFRDEIFSLDVTALSCFRVDSVLPQSFDFINKWSTAASWTALPPVYICGQDVRVPGAKPFQWVPGLKYG